MTEEIVPGYKFSRASYVYSLFRPDIVRDLDLKRHGLHGVRALARASSGRPADAPCPVVFPRSPSSFTPTPDGRHLLLGRSMEEDQREIGG